MVADPDLTLIERVAQGDAMAARTLMTRHLPMVLALGRRMLASADDAEDVAQETFARVWTHAGKWQAGGAQFRTWVHRVAMNLCYDRLRGRRHQDLDAARDVPSADAGPAQIMLQSQVSGMVGSALEDLPDRQREAIVLVHFQAMTNIEAAAEMGVSVEALESLLSRGRRALRAKLLPMAPALLGAMDN